MQQVKLVSEGIGFGTKLVMPNGDTIPGVISVGVPTIRVNTKVTAIVQMDVSIETLAEPIFDLEFLKAAAKVHGFRLVRNGPAST